MVENDFVFVGRIGLVHICLGTTPALQRTMIFDRLVNNDVNRAARVFQNASGKAINVARVLKTLGEQSVVCVPLGGETGLIVRRDLDESGIKYRSVYVSQGTRICVTVIDQSKNEATELVEESGAISLEESGKLREILGEVLGSAKMLILSGSLAQGVGANFYAECCELAGKARVGVILDAKGEELKLALAYRPLVVKVNRAELAGSVGRAIEDETLLRGAMTEVHQLGAEWVIVTLGSEGAFAHDGKLFWKVAAIKIDGVSPIGSGDAFAAGLSSAISRGESVLDACRLASACGAANALIPGAALLRLEDVRRLEENARVERI